MCGWLCVYLSLLLLIHVSYSTDVQDRTQLPITDPSAVSNSAVVFGEWDVIGPFRIGTREAVWGADPLRAFDNDQHAEYPSSLVPNGTVKWEKRLFRNAFDGLTGVVNFHLTFSSIDWAFFQSIYGWTALQYQAWAKSQIIFDSREAASVLVYPTHILELVWNGRRIFGGDFFGYERAPIVLRLLPGQNFIQVRLIRDVRVNGAMGMPEVEASLRFDLVTEEFAVIVPGSAIVPDMIAGRYASAFASITVCNVGHDPITLHGITGPENEELDLLSSELVIAPGQSRPIGFSIYRLRPSQSSVMLDLLFSPQGNFEAQSLSFVVDFFHADTYETHKITFVHPVGAVSYAIMRPPPRITTSPAEYGLPILLNLHGAGLDVDSSQVRHSFDQAADLPCWMLFPSGMSQWSGDDWHTWGLMDIYAAIEAITVWAYMHGWQGPQVLQNGVIVSGHSNGGQGAWHFAMHHPDKVYAVAAVSGYTSIQNYVPYTFWNDAEPQQSAVIETVLSSYKHELFVGNLQRTPVHIQHGSADDNVPAYHSRLMSVLASLAHVNFSYLELAGAGHWFEGAMTTPSLLDFYREYCKPGVTVPPPPSRFSFVVPVSDDLSSKYGIVIDQLRAPERLGRVTVKTRTHSDGSMLWHLMTSNIHRLHFDVDYDMLPDTVTLDSWPHIIDLRERYAVTTLFTALANGQWKAEHDFQSSIFERSGGQRGALEAILRTKGPFQIVCSPQTFNIAVDISRNLLQYFGADSRIRDTEVHRRKEALAAPGNIITIVLGMHTPPAVIRGFPIFANQSGVLLRSGEGRSLTKLRGAIGAVWLQPLPEERLELILWGVDETGLQQAARMVPTLTGVGQPDFIVFGKEAAWKGHAGTLAMGLFDYSWNMSSASYLP